jgi:hypothetical protein
VVSCATEIQQISVPIISISQRRSIIILFCKANAVASGQLKGIKTMSGDYPTIAAAVM